MRRTVSCSLLLLLASFSSSRIDAQAGAPSLSAIETAVACAPPLTTDDAPSNSPRIIGAQDTTARACMDRGISWSSARAPVRACNSVNSFSSGARTDSAPLVDRRWQGCSYARVDSACGRERFDIDRRGGSRLRT
jgi:hypothetical protein